MSKIAIATRLIVANLLPANRAKPLLAKNARPTFASRVKIANHVKSVKVTNALRCMQNLKDGFMINRSDVVALINYNKTILDAVAFSSGKPTPPVISSAPLVNKNILNQLKSVILAMETKFSNNCNCLTNPDCCQTCQSTTCQSSTCQTCQSCQTTTCQSSTCQSQCKCQSNCGSNSH